MRRMFGFRKFVFLAMGILLLFIAVSGVGQASPRAQSGPLWRDISESSLPANAERLASFKQGRMLEMNVTSMQALLDSAPAEADPLRAERLVTIPLPLPDGSLVRFAEYESPIMAPALVSDS